MASFGNHVLKIVLGCSDSDVQPRPPWRERKAAYIAHLAEADRSVVLVSASDKPHNSRSILSDLYRVGVDVWNRFKPSREESIGYYRALVEGFRANPTHDVALVDELDRTVTAFEGFRPATGDCDMLVSHPRGTVRSGLT